MPREVSFPFDLPWEGRHSFSVTVAKEGGLYRASTSAKPGHARSDLLCRKPGWHRLEQAELGLFEIQGSRANNIV